MSTTTAPPAGRSGKTMIRTHQPELLDALPPDHPDAQHSRRDLRLINRIAGNHRWIREILPPRLGDGEHVLEIGAGTGELGELLAASGIAIDGLDLWPRPLGWPGPRAWHVADLRAFSGFADYSVIIGNLIFHQFTDAELRALGATLRRSARLIIACEPTRRRVSQALLRTLGPLLGANHVTRHDAHVSVAAGFRGDELPRLLGLTGNGWNLSCETTALGSYRMVAQRHP
jgi:hypothetical protein